MAGLPGSSPRREFTFAHGDYRKRAVFALATATALPSLEATTGTWLSEREREAGGSATGTFANFGQYRFASWLAGDRTFALVGSRNAKRETALPDLFGFTRTASPR